MSVVWYENPRWTVAVCFLRNAPPDLYCRPMCVLLDLEVSVRLEFFRAGGRGGGGVIDWLINFFGTNSKVRHFQTQARTLQGWLAPRSRHNNSIW